MRLALGIDENLDEFAEEHDAVTWTYWGSADWRSQLHELAADQAIEFVWNLTDVEITEGLGRAVLAEQGVPVGGATDWELLQFCLNHSWRARARFFVDGVEAPDPFAAIGWCEHGSD